MRTCLITFLILLFWADFVNAQTTATAGRVSTLKNDGVKILLHSPQTANVLPTDGPVVPDDIFDPVPVPASTQRVTTIVFKDPITGKLYEFARRTADSKPGSRPESSNPGDMDYYLDTNAASSASASNEWRITGRLGGELVYESLPVADLRRMADSGNARAMHVLSDFCWQGKGVPANRVEAIKWLRSSAALGYAPAQHSLGDCYLTGAGMEKDSAKAVSWYRKAADQGNADAQFNLAVCFSKGEGVAQNDIEVVKWFQKAAEQGFANAQLQLGVCFAEGQGVAKDASAAVRWFRKAGEQGVAIAQYLLGLYYTSGVGVPEDEAEAVKWFRKAAEQGDADAQFSLGMAFAEGKGVAKEDAEAAKWFRKAAEQGNVKAQFHLGSCYANGDGVALDKVEAVKWYRKAGAQGDADAQDILGLSYTQGSGVQKNDAEAVHWFRKAAEQGSTTALFYLGTVYDAGVGVPQDKAEAVKWYRKAAEQGHASAQFSLGSMYDEGDGVPRDKAEAVKWYRKAAEQGHASAQFNLWCMYHKGEGVIQDDVEAMKWRLLVEAQGEGEPEQLRARREEMLPSDYAEAQRRARDWQAKREQPAGGGDGAASTDASSPANQLITSGSAFCVSETGYFLTCAHVVADAGVVTICMNGRECRAEIVKRDRVNDVAILKASGSGFTALPLGRDEPPLGAKVFTVGFPNPELQGQAPKYTDGAVSSLSGIQDDPRAYQITVPVQSGNSGGPLVDASGNCVGIVVAKLNAVAVLEYTGDIPQNVNFAVKMAYAWPLVNAIPDLKSQIPVPRTGAASVADVERAVGLVLVRQGLPDAPIRLESSRAEDRHPPALSDFDPSSTALPPNGSETHYSTANAIAPLTITTPRGAEHYFVKIVDSASDATVMTIFIRAGQSVSTKVPLGSFKIRYAAGEKWLGESALFGPDTSYNEADRRFDFEQTETKISGFTVELVLQSNGNLETKRIKPTDF